MNTIAERVDYSRKQIGLSYKALGELFGITWDAVRKTIERNNIKPIYINTFSDKYKIPKEWIEKGIGEFSFCIDKNNKVVVKRIINNDVKYGDLTLHSLNEFYNDFVVNLNDIKQIFNIVEVQQKRKRRWKI
jgi:hypothetical protein